MPTEGTEKVLGGTPAKRYPDPVVKNTANPNGLYPWSAFRAPLATVVDDGIEVPFNLEQIRIDLLLFTSDLPAICWLVAEADQDSSTRVQFFNYVENNTECQFLYADPTATSLATVANIGQVLRGYVNNYLNIVYCTGFNARVPFPVTVPYGSTEGQKTRYYVACVANGATVNGPIAYSQRFPQGTLSAPEPVILYAPHYTQAMKDAGNIFVDRFGNVCLIVGLWFQPS